MRYFTQKTHLFLHKATAYICIQMYIFRYSQPKRVPNPIRLETHYFSFKKNKTNYESFKKYAVRSNANVVEC